MLNYKRMPAAYPPARHRETLLAWEARCWFVARLFAASSALVRASAVLGIFAGSMRLAQPEPLDVGLRLFFDGRRGPPVRHSRVSDAQQMIISCPLEVKPNAEL